MHIYIPLCLIIYLELYQCPLFTRGGAGQSPEAKTTEAVVGERSGRDREQAFSDALRGVVAVVQRRDARVADLPHLDLGHLVGHGRFEAPVPDEVPKIEMRKVGDARVSPLHYGDDAAEGV